MRTTEKYGDRYLDSRRGRAGDNHGYPLDRLEHQGRCLRRPRSVGREHVHLHVDAQRRSGLYQGQRFRQRIPRSLTRPGGLGGERQPRHEHLHMDAGGRNDATHCVQVGRPVRAGAAGLRQSRSLEQGGPRSHTAAPAAACAPAISSLSPSGVAKGGASVTITGVNLAAATTVKFGSCVATIVSKSATRLTVTAPAHAVGTVDVCVTTPAGTSAESATARYTYFNRYEETDGRIFWLGAWTGKKSTSYSGRQLRLLERRGERDHHHPLLRYGHHLGGNGERERGDGHSVHRWRGSGRRVLRRRQPRPFTGRRSGARPALSVATTSSRSRCLTAASIWTPSR